MVIRVEIKQWCNRTLSIYASVSANNNLKSRLLARKYSNCVITWHQAATSGYCSQKWSVIRVIRNVFKFLPGNNNDTFNNSEEFYWSRNKVVQKQNNKTRCLKISWTFSILRFLKRGYESSLGEEWVIILRTVFGATKGVADESSK